MLTSCKYADHSLTEQTSRFQNSWRSMKFLGHTSSSILNSRFSDSKQLCLIWSRKWTNVECAENLSEKWQLNFYQSVNHNMSLSPPVTRHQSPDHSHCHSQLDKFFKNIYYTYSIKSYSIGTLMWLTPM